MEFLRPLLTDMIQEDGNARPTMEDVTERFDELIKGTKASILRSPCIKKLAEGFSEPVPIVLIRAFRHWYKRMTYTVRRLPPVPTR